MLILALLLLLVGGVMERRARTRGGSHPAPTQWRRHAVPLFVFTVSGALLRVAQGPRIPGFEGGHGTAHGFGDVAAALTESVPRLDEHGNGPAALAELWFALWPRTESGLLTLQATLAVLTIPLVYLGALAWLRVQREATWATAIYALYPSAAYFAMTEVRAVPGAFFLALGLVVTAFGIERGRAFFVASGGLFVVFAASFHPVLVGGPVVLALFAISRRDTWAFSRSPRALLALATVALAWAILLRLAWLQRVLAAPGAIIGGGAVGVLRDAWPVLLPTFGLPRYPFNAFLNVQVTPALFVLCWGLGAAQVRTPQRRRVLVTLLLAAVGMTIPGMSGGRYSLARLQYAAALLHAMLAGVGCVALLEYAVGRLSTPRLRRAVPAGLAIALGLSVAVSPGPLAGAFVYEGERQVTLRAMPALRAGAACDVWVPPTPEGSYPDAPSYLTAAALPESRWRLLERVEDVPGEVGRSLAHGGCAYYFRPSVCWSQRHEEPPGPDPTALRPECAAVESQLVLTPLHVEAISARPAAAANYRRPRIEVGFFRIDSLAL